MIVSCIQIENALLMMLDDFYDVLHRSNFWLLQYEKSYFNDNATAILRINYQCYVQYMIALNIDIVRENRH